jgi:transcriptional regulator with XRE-family HTH domain
MNSLRLNSNFGYLLKTKREQASLTKEDLAELMEYNTATIQAWEANKSVPQSRSFISLAEHLNWPTIVSEGLYPIIHVSPSGKRIQVKVYEQMCFSGITYTELGKLTGTSIYRLSQIVSGKKLPTLCTTLKMTEVLKCEVEDLYTVVE